MNIEICMLSETVIVKGWGFHGVFMLRAAQKYLKQKFCQICLLPFTGFLSFS